MRACASVTLASMPDASALAIPSCNSLRLVMCGMRAGGVLRSKSDMFLSLNSSFFFGGSVQSSFLTSTDGPFLRTQIVGHAASAVCELMRVVSLLRLQTMDGS